MAICSIMLRYVTEGIEYRSGLYFQLSYEVLNDNVVIKQI